MPRPDVVTGELWRLPLTCAAAAECCQMAVGMNSAAADTADAAAAAEWDTWLKALASPPGAGVGPVTADAWPEVVDVPVQLVAAADPTHLCRQRDRLYFAAVNGEAEYAILEERGDTLHCARLYARVWRG